MVEHRTTTKPKHPMELWDTLDQACQIQFDVRVAQ